MVADRVRAEGGATGQQGQSVVRELPLSRWAARFRGGTVEAAGVLDADVVLTAGALAVRVARGDVAVWLRFTGGEAPQILEAEVRAVGLRAGLEGQLIEGEELAISEGMASVDGVPVAGGDPDVEVLVGALVDHVGSLSFVATATPSGELVVRLPAGVQVSLDGQDEVVVSGASEGPPGGLRLCAPLEVRCGGEGFQLSHEQFRRLARLARVRISAATLHPDGEVALEGGASVGLDRAVRGGLVRTSQRLSRLVRTSPHFRKLRTFLNHAREA